MREEGKGGRGYVELPSLDRFAGFFACDDDDQFGDFAARHPLVELRHDFLDVGFHLVVHCDCEPRKGEKVSFRVGSMGLPGDGKGGEPSMLRPYFLTLLSLISGCLLPGVLWALGRTLRSLLQDIRLVGIWTSH